MERKQYDLAAERAAIQRHQKYDQWMCDDHIENDEYDWDGLVRNSSDDTPWIFDQLSEREKYDTIHIQRDYVPSTPRIYLNGHPKFAFHNHRDVPDIIAAMTLPHHEGISISYTGEPLDSEGTVFLNDDTTWLTEVIVRWVLPHQGMPMREVVVIGKRENPWQYVNVAYFLSPDLRVKEMVDDGDRVRIFGLFIPTLPTWKLIPKLVAEMDIFIASHI